MFDFKYIYEGKFSNLHWIHSYPAKFPSSIPAQLIDKLAIKGDIILDPFCWSWTTLLEWVIRGYKVIWNDINHIALLISKVKTNFYDNKDILFINTFIDKLKQNFLERKEYNYILFDWIDHWFQKNVQYELNLIIQMINEYNIEVKIKDYLKLIVSKIIIDVSNQESDTRYASKNKDIKDWYTINIFIKKTIDNFQYLLKDESKYWKADILSEDSKLLSSIGDNSVDLIITSPPYANTYDYYLYHKHRMNWLGYDYKFSQNTEIWSRREYSSLKKDKQKWFNDIKDFIEAFYRVLKINKHMCIIIWDSVINKELIDISVIVKDICKNLKLELVLHDYVSLKSNSRKFNHKFRSEKDKNEHILIFKKY